MLQLQEWLSDASTVLSRSITLRNAHSKVPLHLLALNLHPNRHSYLTVLDDEGLWQQQLYAGVGNTCGAQLPGANCVTLKPGTKSRTMQQCYIPYPIDLCATRNVR